MPKITVDGKSIEAKQGQMVLQACNDAGVDIPQYCYHPGLSIVASCRICLVEVEGIPKLVPGVSNTGARWHGGGLPPRVQKPSPMKSR